MGSVLGSRYNGLASLFAGMVLMLILGSVHAFSVFLEPLETAFSVSRSLTSATYSIALVCLTASVLFGHHIFRRYRPAPVALTLCLVAAGGCLIAGHGVNIYIVWLAYGAIFGGANGIGYALSLQTAAQANPQRRGLAVGTITACYALGAAVSPYLFDLALKQGGFSGAMFGLSAVLGLAGIAVFLTYRFANARLEVAASAPLSEVPGYTHLRTKLWLSYGTAVFGGLMIIGHTTGIMRIVTSESSLVLFAPVAVALLNMIGSLIGGYLVDRLRLKLILVILPLLSVIALAGLLASTSPILVAGLLGMVGFAYGAIISAYPVAVSNYYGVVGGVSAYGRVFTAWGTAGLVGPIVAGGMYEAFGGYQQALLLAGISDLASVAFVLTLKNPDTVSRQQA